MVPRADAAEGASACALRMLNFLTERWGSFLILFTTHPSLFCDPLERVFFSILWALRTLGGTERPRPAAPRKRETLPGVALTGESTLRSSHTLLVVASIGTHTLCRRL